MLNSHVFSNLLAERWNQSIANPTLTNWLNVAHFADSVANAVERCEPDHILVASARGVSRAARVRIAAMSPSEYGDAYDNNERTAYLETMGEFK